jgi:hypothetical protein
MPSASTLFRTEPSQISEHPVQALCPAASTDQPGPVWNKYGSTLFHTELFVLIFRFGDYVVAQTRNRYMIGFHILGLRVLGMLEQWHSSVELTQLSANFPTF